MAVRVVPAASVTDAVTTYVPGRSKA